MKKSKTSPYVAPLAKDGHLFPVHWPWLLPADLLALPFPRETRSTCQACPKSINRMEHEAACCAYRPQMPAFLTGLALRLGDLPAARFEQLLEDDGLTPLASLDPPGRTTADEEDRKAGRSPAPCSYWRDGRCTVHRLRNHICSTWFCLSLGGTDDGFWQTMADLMMMLENNLSWWLLDQLGPKPVPFLRGLCAMDSRSRQLTRWRQEDLQRIRGPWQDDPTGFYLRCADLVLEQQEQLRDKATGFLDRSDAEFRRLVEEIRDDISTHLPASSRMIAAAEKKAGRILRRRLEQTPPSESACRALQSALRAPAQVPQLTAAYPEAVGFLLLTDGNGVQVDFQPLTTGQRRWILSPPEKLTPDQALLFAGLRRRGFFS